LHNDLLPAVSSLPETLHPSFKVATGTLQIQANVVLVDVVDLTISLESVNNRHRSAIGVALGAEDGSSDGLVDGG
jgi:hypothetical protein